MLKLKKPFVHRRLRRIVVEHVDGAPLLVLPGVLNPVLFRSGELLARTLARSPVASCPAPGQAWALDMGTGSGIGAIFAARCGYRVIGVDINPAAVRCAQINVLLNHLEGQVEIRQGDLFGVVAGLTFDLVLFNPPFFVGQPKNAADRAWRGLDVIERFAAGLPQVLTPAGQTLVVLSTDGEPERMLRALRGQRLVVEVVAKRDFGNEIMGVYSARRTRADQDGGGGHDEAMQGRAD